MSIIIPTFNHSIYVTQTLQSVFAQTHAEYEVIVVNDGSPDATATVLRPYVESGRIRYIEQPNAGQAAARNRGFMEAKGEFVAFLDDDDLWEPDNLEWQVELLRANPKCVLAFGQRCEMGSRGERHPTNDPPAKNLFRAFLTSGWIQSPGQVLIRRSAFDAVGGFDTGIWGTDDWDLWLRLSQIGDFAFAPRLSLNYRRHSNNASLNVVRMYKNAMKVARKHTGFFPTPATLASWYRCRQFVRVFASEDAMRACNQLRIQNCYRKAASILLNAVLIRPRLLLQWRTMAAAFRIAAAGVSRSCLP